MSNQGSSVAKDVPGGQVAPRGERPILFSGAMVRALLDGRKTQTRRVVKPRRSPSLFDLEDDGSPVWTDSYILDPGNAEWRMRDNRYGVPGDLLWVREAGNWAGPMTDHLGGPDVGIVAYAADAAPGAFDIFGGKMRPSIHMPRWASRITLRVTDVRVERLQDITPADALAEGVYPGEQPPETFDRTYSENMAVHLYGGLWDHINGPGSWDANPWVWAVSFERAADASATATASPAERLARPRDEPNV